MLSVQASFPERLNQAIKHLMGGELASGAILAPGRVGELEESQKEVIKKIDGLKIDVEKLQQEERAQPSPGSPGMPIGELAGE